MIAFKFFWSEGWVWHFGRNEWADGSRELRAHFGKLVVLFQTEKR